MDKPTSLCLSQVQLKHFRCFESFQLDIEAPILLLEGANGVGKTSFLEALYYTCYLRSFRTHIPKELIAFGKDSFFVKVAVRGTEPGISHVIQVGFSHNKRLVKVDQKPILSYKELMGHYRIVSVTEDDLELVKGSPQARRLFMDQVLMVIKPSYGQELRSYRQVVDQRNALLQQKIADRHIYDILTEQLWEKSRHIQCQREELLARLEKRVNLFCETCIHEPIRIRLSYLPKRKLACSFGEFCNSYPELYDQEKRFGRSLFGVHLDDVSIIFCDRKSRIFASRGQQKLIVMLIKMAQQEFLAQGGSPTLFLLDDFMTDFDPERVLSLLRALEQLNSQLIFTTPSQESFLEDQLRGLGAQVSKLTY